MLHLESKKEAGSQRLKETRKRFLFAYERTYGNVSASCEYAGISRQTFYRWMRSASRVNRRFQKKINGARPQDRLVDLAESRLVQKINDGDIAAIIYALKTKGRDRGWAEARAQVQVGMPAASAIEHAARAFRLWLADFPDSKMPVRLEWAARFARVASIEYEELLAAVDLKPTND